MKLPPRMALLLERCEIDALEFLRCWAGAVRRMEENRRGELAGPAEKARQTVGSQCPVMRG